MLPLFLWALWRLLADYGFSARARCGMVLVAALSPVTVVFSFSLMPELLFTALLLAAVILAERAMKPEVSVWLAVAAGVCAALAYLTKSIAAPLLFTVPLCFALRTHYRKAGIW
jgi:4-amino-4-deoxy-L-arabinose transferase-like glycosyltransferase